VQRIMLGLVLAASAAPAAAEVKSVEANGFAVRSVATIAAAPEAVWAALVKPGGWWDSAHTYSGDAANMTIEPVPGGCFCESVPKAKGAVEHGRIIQAMPGALLRFSGGLGPLQSEGVAATMTWELKASATGTEISQTYVAGGYIQGGTKALAPLVDQVLGHQLVRLKAFVEKK
jgi:uncharacterized protein YndB with AHSA1/START domain